MKITDKKEQNLLNVTDTKEIEISWLKVLG